MKKILQIAAGMVLGTVITSGIEMLLYKPLAGKIAKASMNLATEMMADLDED